MTIIDLLKRIVTHETAQDDGWSQKQREAFVNLLLLGMYVDGKLSVEENDLLEKEIQTLTAETGIDWEGYVSKALHRVRAVVDKPEQRYQFVQEIRDNLDDFDRRQTAARELETLLAVDGEIPEEHTFLEEVNALFRIRPLPGDED